jgi:hypothetical protein
MAKAKTKVKAKAKASTEERLLALLEANQRQQAELQLQQMDVLGGMLNAVQEQSKLIGGYLKMFTDVPKPEVRIMTDADEIRTEERIKQRKLADDLLALEKLPVEQTDWLGQMDGLFKDLKGEI